MNRSDRVPRLRRLKFSLECRASDSDYTGVQIRVFAGKPAEFAATHSGFSQDREHCPKLSISVLDNRPGQRVFMAD
jgi:hypothetical protein